MFSEGKLNPAALVTHVGGLDAVVDTTLNLPKIPGGKKLIYNHIKMPLVALSDLSELGKDRVELTVICPERLETSVKHQIQIWQQVLGISLAVKLEIKTSEEIEAAVSKGEYQIALTSVESAYDSAVDFIADFRGGGIFRFESTDFDLVVDKLLQVESDSDLLGGCFTAEHYILQHGIFFPLYSRSSRFVTLEDIEGIVIGESENTVSFIGAKRYD
jgi:hypothetical protein